MSPDARPFAWDRSALDSARRLAMRLSRELSCVASKLLRWQEIAGQRRALLSLDERMLKDIGLSRVDALREASRPFWDDRGMPWLS